MDLSYVRRVAVIGAGEAGIATAKMLLAEGLDVQVFERNSRIGGVWTTGYLDFGLQVQHELYEFPDFPMPAGTPDFTPGPMVRQYIQDYADHFGVTPHVRLNTTVTDVSERPDGARGWRVSYHGADGEAQQTDYDLVVVSVGVYSHTPHLPELPTLPDFAGTHLHSSELQSREQLAGRRVVVVGYGKSATDAAVLAAEHAAEATIVFREPRWPVPAKLFGVIPFKYAMFNRLTNAMLPTHYNASTAKRAWHRIGKPVIWLFWRLVEQAINLQCGLRRPGRGPGDSPADLRPSQPIEYDGFSNSTMLPKPEFFQHLHSGRLRAARSVIQTVDSQGVTLANGERVDCDQLIFATGWRTDYGFLDAGIRRHLRVDADGYYLYRQILHPDLPGLAFIGSNAVTYSNILTHNLQARWLADLIVGHHSLPSDATMRAEVRVMREWKRSVVPPSTSRAATLHLHMQQYHDDLLRDMGLDPRIKRGFGAWLKEWLAPYQPSDYAAVSSGAAWHGRGKGERRTDLPGPSKRAIPA